VKLTKDKRTVILTDPVQITAFKNSGWAEAAEAPGKTAGTDSKKDGKGGGGTK
jgi:hypothetical protein